MTVDEQQLSDALHALEVDVTPDLAGRVRRGGQRRLLRRRSAAVAGVTAVAALGVPVGLAVRSHSAGALPGIQPAGSGGPASQVLSDLYATPPPAGSECNGGFTAVEKPAAYPQLLILPAGQQTKYAFVRQNQASCIDPHVALTAYQLDGSTLMAEVVVKGPDAPTAIEAGRQGADVAFEGDTGHLPVDGRPATEFTVASAGDSTVYWTEPDGGQWSAEVSGMSQADAAALLNRISYDGHEGTATQPATAGWTTAPAAADAPKDSGWVTAQWTDVAGHQVDLSVTQTPDRTVQAVDGLAGNGASFVSARGHRAALVVAKDRASLTWQEAPDVQVQLMLDGADETTAAAELQQLAAGLEATTPDDSRFSDN